MTARLVGSRPSPGTQKGSPESRFHKSKAPAPGCGLAAGTWPRQASVTFCCWGGLQRPLVHSLAELSEPVPSPSSLFMPVVNLEKISSLPKPDGHGIKVPPKAAAASAPGQPPASSKEPMGKLSLALSPKEPLVPAKAGVDSVVPADGLDRKSESASASGEKEPGATKPPPKSHKKMARESCYSSFAAQWG